MTDHTDHRTEALVVEVARLEKEADWLAAKLSDYVHGCIHPDRDCTPSITSCAVCWRDAAHKAIKETDYE